MPEEIRHPDGRIEHPSVRHEPSDVSLCWVLGTLIAGAILGVVIHYVIMMYFTSSRDALAEARKSRFPLTAARAPTLPPEPRLEQIDRLAATSADLHAREKASAELLGSYGPTGEKGFIHIPINRAMKFLANKLPARSAPEPFGGIGAGTLGLLGSPSGPLLAAAALFPERIQVEEASLRRRYDGLVNGGAANSGRVFNRRTPRWYGP